MLTILRYHYNYHQQSLFQSLRLYRIPKSTHTHGYQNSALVPLEVVVGIGHLIASLNRNR